MIKNSQIFVWRLGIKLEIKKITQF